MLAQCVKRTFARGPVGKRLLSKMSLPMRPAAAAAALFSPRVGTSREPLLQSTLQAAGSVRSFSLLDKPREYLEERAQKKQDDQFQKQMSELLKHNKLTLGIYRDFLKKSLEQESGWKTMMPGVKSSDEWKELTSQIAFLDSLTPAMLRKPNLINGTTKKKAAETLGRPVEKLNSWLKAYQQLETMHMWLKRLKADGKPLPSTQKEAVDMMMKDPKGISPKQMQIKRPRR